MYRITFLPLAVLMLSAGTTGAQGTSRNGSDRRAAQPAKRSARTSLACKHGAPDASDPSYTITLMLDSASRALNRMISIAAAEGPAQSDVRAHIETPSGYAVCSNPTTRTEIFVTGPQGPLKLSVKVPTKQVVFRVAQRETGATITRWLMTSTSGEYVRKELP